MYKHNNANMATMKGLDAIFQNSENLNVRSNREELIRSLKVVFKELEESVTAKDQGQAYGNYKQHTNPRKNPSDKTSPVSFWSNVSKSDQDAYESAVEVYMAQPKIAATTQKILLLEDGWRRDDLEAICDANINGTRVAGYVYAAWNPLFQDLIKIGATMRTPQIRVRELSSTGVPEPFQVIASVPSTNPFTLEREVHAHFASARKYGTKKEFFLLDQDQVVSYFEKLVVKAMTMPAKPLKRAETKLARLRKMYLKAEARAAALAAMADKKEEL